MALSQTSVLKVYNTVIEDVISGVREAFLDEGVDEQVLQELKQIWETKLMASKAVEINPEPPEPQPPQLNSKNNANKAGSRRNTQTAVQVQHTNDSSVPNSQIQQQSATTNSQLPQQIQHSSQTQVQHQAQAISQQQQIQQHMQNIAAAQQQMLQQQQQQQAQHHAAAQQVINQPSTAVSADRQISIQIKLPIHQNLPERLITVHVPASAVQRNQLGSLFTGPIISAAIALPVPFATSLLQQHVNSTFENVPGFVPVPVHPVHIVEQQAADNMLQQQIIQGQHGNIAQLDGAAGDSSDDDEDEEEEEDNDDDEDPDEEKDDDDNDDSGAREEEPLNSEDDVTDEDPADLFDTDNVVVCQYDKITRSRNKWKFYLKDGIMNLNGKDLVFQKATGDAEW